MGFWHNLNKDVIYIASTESVKSLLFDLKLFVCLIAAGPWSDWSDSLVRVLHLAILLTRHRIMFSSLTAPPLWMRQGTLSLDICSYVHDFHSVLIHVS